MMAILTNEISPIYSLVINGAVSAIAVMVTYIVSKQNRWNAGVTQFRQKWIDNLRDSISLYIAKAEMISMLDLDDDEKYYTHFEDLSRMQNKVELLLNPNENDHNNLIAKMEEIRELIHDENEEDLDLFEKLVDNKIKELLIISKAVLKKEWNVVKNGK